MEQKKTYYVEIASGEITQSATSSPWNFGIEATEQDIKELREQFNIIDTNKTSDFLRAHMPFKEYHYDHENDVYDAALKKIYAIVYRLGDNEARRTIDEMGIIQQDQESFDC